MKVRCVSKCWIEDENGEKIRFEKGKIYKFKETGPSHWPMILVNGEWYDIVCYPTDHNSFTDVFDVDLFRIIGAK